MEQNELTHSQVKKLIHAFGLDYAQKPYRNYYFVNNPDEEWEDMVSKGYATKREESNSTIYHGTHKALQLVFRRNVTEEYFNSI